MRLNPMLWIRSQWSYPVVFCAATLAAASFIAAAEIPFPEDAWRYGAFGLVNTLVVLGALFVALGYCSEKGDSHPLRTLALTALAGGVFGLLPPIAFPLILLLSFPLGAHFPLVG